ncbi:hypothetical protein EKD04_016275 [Chloroflexales bacterium ZM16-3]|nr:hypothetical protein [Chloroflexales bacterium ZM16-3]
MTQIELAAPACLTLAAARIDGRPALLGIALRHPPVHLIARPAPRLAASGARADVAYHHGKAFMSSKNMNTAADFEIELAIPAYMGLGSTPLIGLSVARAMAALHGLPTDDAQALAAAAGVEPAEGLAIQSFGGGGLLLVDESGAALRRYAISHSSEPQDWVFVLALPRPPTDTPDDLEVAEMNRLWRAAAGLDERAEQLVAGRLWPAAEGDDIDAFGAALMELQGIYGDNEASPEEQAILAIMRAGGAVAWGRAPTGLGLYGLIRGGEPSRRLRQSLVAHVGHAGGTIMATICETGGVRQRDVQHGNTA